MKQVIIPVTLGGKGGHTLPGGSSGSPPSGGR
jgi:hypothetical protein